MSQISSKETIARLAKICSYQGIRHVVISPGSRNAPLTISFAENESFQCINIPDERSAAFFALGMAQSLGEPVILCCTSGSAAVNYGPALAEAYYQYIPLIVLSADRPIQWIDQRAGQTIRQNGIFENYIKKSYQISGEVKDEEGLWYNDRLINEAINLCKADNPGPVHVNVHLREPLYDVIDSKSIEEPKIIQLYQAKRLCSEQFLSELSDEFNRFERVLLICGQGEEDDKLNRCIDTFAAMKQVVVLTETTSNIKATNALQSIDRIIDSISEDEYPAFSPDLIITIGHAIVSKKIRFMLRQMDVNDHWQIHPNDSHIDTYKKLTKTIQSEPSDVLKALSANIEHSAEMGQFKQTWLERDRITRKAHDEFVKKMDWNDLYIFNTLLERIPAGFLHLASSTPVRYAQLFEQRNDISYYCNRGVSGIDGCTSTAAGFAFTSNSIVTLITGDIAFFYDSNGLWHNHLSDNLKIIMINNGGGNIFRYVKGPSKTNHLEEHFESAHSTRAEGIAQAYGIAYNMADDFESLEKGLSHLFDRTGPAMLEIFTPGNTNIHVLKEYFDFLRHQSKSE